MASNQRRSLRIKEREEKKAADKLLANQQQQKKTTTTIVTIVSVKQQQQRRAVHVEKTNKRKRSSSSSSSSSSSVEEYVIEDVNDAAEEEERRRRRRRRRRGYKQRKTTATTTKKKHPLSEYDREHKRWIPFPCDALTDQPLTVDLEVFSDAYRMGDVEEKHIRGRTPKDLYEKMNGCSRVSYFIGYDLTYDEMAASVEPLERFTIETDKLLERTVLRKTLIPKEDVEAHRLIDEEILRQKRILFVANEQYEYSKAASEFIENKEEFGEEADFW